MRHNQASKCDVSRDGNDPVARNKARSEIKILRKHEHFTSSKTKLECRTLSVAIESVNMSDTATGCDKFRHERFMCLLFQRRGPFVILRHIWWYI